MSKPKDLVEGPEVGALSDQPAALQKGSFYDLPVDMHALEGEPIALEVDSSYDLPEALEMVAVGALPLGLGLCLSYDLPFALPVVLAMGAVGVVVSHQQMVESPATAFANRKSWRSNDACSSRFRLHPSSSLLSGMTC